jgi:hypothetical protein
MQREEYTQMGLFEAKYSVISCEGGLKCEIPLELFNKAFV